VHCSQVAHEIRVHICFSPTNSVMQMRDRKHEADLGSSLDQPAQQRDGVRTSGDGNGDAHAGAQKLTMNWRSV
jgi:hypothetical protein